MKISLDASKKIDLAIAKWKKKSKKLENSQNILIIYKCGLETYHNKKIISNQHKCKAWNVGM